MAMTNPKPVYLLAGGRGSKNRGVFKAVLREIPKPNPLIAYVGAANDDDKRFFKFMGDEIAKACECLVSHAIIASKKADLEKARNILRKADAIFISGGDVDHGMRILESKGMLNIFSELYREGKVFFSASAGSIMLCKQWIRWKDPADDLTAEIFPCLGIVPLICDTHAEEDDWEELKTALRMAEDRTVGFGIPSGACLKIYSDGTLEALGGDVVRLVKRGKDIIGSDDLIAVQYAP
jgi:cyanophycinase-like exopeptidase